jgi:hypothetical protein
MDREERLAEVQRRWLDWARTAESDDPPDDLYADLVAEDRERADETMTP